MGLSLKMARTTKAILLIAIAAAATLLVSAWVIAGRGFSARDKPTVVEAFVARRLRSLATPKDAQEAQNPVHATEEVLSEAMAHFADHCAFCHANDGSGDTDIGKGLYPKPPDMRLPDTQNLTDGELYYIIHNGIRLTGMPAFGDGTAEEPDHESWKLVHFIRHLPLLTAEELERMESMNPKSQEEFRREEEVRRFLRGED
jgi:mono/diheme cytochrome c family protein